MAATQNFGNMTDLEKVEKHRASFNENIAKMQEAVSKNSKFLTRADHDRKVARLLALNNVEEKATLSDMNLTRSLAVLNIESNGNLVQNWVKRGTNLRLIPVEDLFDVLMFEHGVTEHGGRDIMHDKTSKKYANVTVVIIKAFLQSCLHCCLKKSRTRKNLVVKPIISPDMGVDLEVGMVVDMEIRGVDKIVIGVGQLDLNFFSLKLNTQFTHLFCELILTRLNVLGNVNIAS